MNYVESKMVNASGKMAKNLGTDIFLDGTGTNSSTINLDGFQQALDNGKGIAVVKSGYMRETPKAFGTRNGNNLKDATMGNPQGRPGREPSETNTPDATMAKIESDLHGDMQSRAETTLPLAA